MDVVDTTIIGAGIVGIAIARALALTGRSVLLIEKEKHFCTHASSRNSEVIHSGVYYRAGSLKAVLCLEGRNSLYDYCEKRHIAFRRCGKLIVAGSTEEIADLEDIQRRARANGVMDLQELTAQQAKKLEPNLICSGALLSPSTGIIDSHAYAVSLLGEAEANGAQLILKTPFMAASIKADGFEVSTGGGDPFQFKSRELVNAAGMWATDVAQRIEGDCFEAIPRTQFAKGNYFSLMGPAPFSHLVYPIPEPGGLGIHFTVDLAGNGRFGPDVEWVDKFSYTVDEARLTDFWLAIRRYWPSVKKETLQPAYCGIRAKIPEKGDPQDFCIIGPKNHGVAGLVNLFGIESPGLTSSLSIADLVVEKLKT